MAIFAKVICGVNANPIKIQTQFFIELERAILKFIWNNKKTQDSENCPQQKDMGESPSLTSSCITEQ